MENALYTNLKSLLIQYTVYEHPAAFTCDEMKLIIERLPADVHAHFTGTGWVKNLFLKDSKKRLWLIVAHSDTKIDLKKVGKALNAPELRFAQAELLKQFFNLEPGSVTPLGIINDQAHTVTVVLDKRLFEYEKIGVHPLRNTATLMLTPTDLHAFIVAHKNKCLIFDFTS